MLQRGWGPGTAGIELAVHVGRVHRVVEHAVGEVRAVGTAEPCGGPCEPVAHAARANEVAEKGPPQGLNFMASAKDNRRPQHPHRTPFNRTDVVIASKRVRILYEVVG